MWANLPCWHGIINFNYKCPPSLGKNETLQPSTKWSVGKEGRCSTLSEQDTKTATCCFDLLVVVLMMRWHYFLLGRGFSDSSFAEHDAKKIQPLFLQDTLLLHHYTEGCMIGEKKYFRLKCLVILINIIYIKILSLCRLHLTEFFLIQLTFMVWKMSMY